MKKFFTLLITLLVCSCFFCSANADVFTIHSGVTFEMNIDEVIAAETTAGFKPEKKSSAKADEDRFFNCLDKHLTDYYIYLEGQIAGQKGSAITYHFNAKTNLLDSAVYDINDYSALRSTLINKYGEPDTTLSKAWHTYLKPDAYNFFDYASDYSTTYNYNDSWLLPQDDGSYIIISGLNAKMVISRSTYSISCIGYQHFSKEEIDTALSTLSDEVNTYTEQINNDL